MMLSGYTATLLLCLCWYMQTSVGVVIKRFYISPKTCGTTLSINQSQPLYLEYHGNHIDFNKTETGRHKRFKCTIDIEASNTDEDTCIETYPFMLGDGCILKFEWHTGSRDFMLYGLSTYWCDMFSYGSICLPVWRSRVRLETLERSMIRIRFSTKDKEPLNTIDERSTNDSKPFVYGLRRRQSLDIYIVLAALVTICACLSVLVVMRHMKKQANGSANIELVELDQTCFPETRTEGYCFTQRHLSPSTYHNNTKLKHYVTSPSDYSSGLYLPPPYLEKPPPYQRYS